MKQCCDCKTWKPLDEFYLHKQGGQKRQSCCKECGRARLKIYKQTPQFKLANRQRWQRKSLPEKIVIFRRADSSMKDPNLTTQNLIKKFGPNPRCYLTGKPIDLTQWASYSLDHIIPIAKGGRSSLENCGLTTREVNYAKRDLLNEQFWQLCQDVVNWKQKDSDKEDSHSLDT